MRKGVNREVFSYWGRGDLRVPAKWEVHGGEAHCKVPGGVLGPKGGEGREGSWESGRSPVAIWGGTGNSEGGKAPLVSAIGNDGGEAGLTG